MGRKKATIFFTDKTKRETTNHLILEYGGIRERDDETGEIRFYPYHMISYYVEKKMTEKEYIELQAKIAKKNEDKKEGS